MINNITDILKKLDIDEAGTYDNHFYVITLKDSNDYARCYTKLEHNAVNTEYPNFATNTNKNTVGITTYFELDFDNTTYNLFLIANFETDEYKLKIGEK